MKVLVTGAKGQLGTDLVNILSNDFDVLGLGRNELDITDLNQVRSVLHEFTPEVVVHAAAYTAVDKAEEDEINAYRVNALGTRNLAMISEELGSKLCYISTDYVFDGKASLPYREYDNTNPVNVYGKTKRSGEIFVQSLVKKHFIVRTSWVYGNHGNNFVKTMLKLMNEKKYLKVVDDQVGSPTYTVDLAYFIKDLINTEKYGIYHASNSGSCSWYEFAKTIFEEKNSSIILEACTTEEFPRPAPRPQYSIMEHLAIQANDFTDLRDWKLALKDYLSRI